MSSRPIGIGFGSLADLARLREARRRRASSFDRSGGNADFWRFEAGQRRRLLEVEGAGCVRHLWITIECPERFCLRSIVLRMWWDQATTPCVEVPVGDFFGMGFGMTKCFASLPLQMSPQDGKAFNCYFAMPFANGAIIEIDNETASWANVYFYVDYEELDRLEDVLGRFHAQWRRENPTQGWGDGMDLIREIWKAPNLEGRGNYVILEAQGRGHYVGCNLNIDQFEPQKNPWYGEGDDMIFIDGDQMPTLHGTGTEDYFGMAWCPTQEFHGPYHGLTHYPGEKWFRRNSMYRFHIEDPVHFQNSIRVTIEHGHANCLANDYSSTAYWYQTEPHATPPKLPSKEDRRPRE